MDFNWGSDVTPNLVDEAIGDAYYLHAITGDNFAATTFTTLKLTDNVSWINFLTIPIASFPDNYNQTTNVITATVNNEQYIIDYEYIVENTDTSDRTVELQWNHEGAGLNNTGTVTIAAGDQYSWVGQISVLMNAGTNFKSRV